ncbi:GbsR/MarR family transcriptional regulator [Fodinicola acaciae]|uniref:GbsR/MarR family transcriptional regulator n=1 Tax=Fodinicola acaciae TaxID=2681555 RepID=UPI0013D7F2A6|nr:transcriptional regulator [Fodinicola acaciae]
MGEPDLEELRAWSEQVATFFASMAGWPPITGRVLGWLMVCDPAEQSAADIVEATGASRASLTSTMRMLVASGMVRRLTRAGGRTTYFRIDDNAWSQVLRQRFQLVAAFAKITGDGVQLLGEGSPRSARVRAAHDIFRWFDQEIEPLWRRYEAGR